ncbi:MAG: DUF5320 domain-containing protein [Chloroflexi bacterium]|nr:DUF5320 domain-containing protein [Chloroflexota bacterium]
MCGAGMYYGPGMRHNRFFSRRMGMRPWWYVSREEAIESLEEYQKDLEEELAEVVSRIEKLRKESASAQA